MSQITGQPDAVLFADASPEATPSLLADLITLTKARIAAMVVATAYLGYAVSAGVRGIDPHWSVLLAVLVGTAVSCMAAGVINQLYERDTDAVMERTRNRPIPAGRITPAHALLLGLGLALTGTLVLWTFTNTLATLINLMCMASYLFIYTPMKRLSSTSTIVGAFPGALPPVIGGAAAVGFVGTEVVVMFAIMFLWQLPHFLAIAWLYREDYARANFPMLPVLDPDGLSTFRQIMLGCMALLPLGLVPTMIGVSGVTYFIGALICGAGFLACGVALVMARTKTHARILFIASLIYLPVVFALMLIDRVS